MDHLAVAARDKLPSATFLQELVSDDVFDRALERIRARGVTYWAGPGHTPGATNTNHGGRGVYFDDPAGHHFELITRPYGAGG